MQEVSPVRLDAAVAHACKQAAAWHPPHARKQLHIDASALLATLKLPDDVAYVNVALNPILSFLDLLGLGTEAPKYATTESELQEVVNTTGGLTSGQTSPLDPKTVYYDLRAIRLSNKLGMTTDGAAEVLTHETIHLAQYADLRRAGKDPVREAVRSNIVNQYDDNPMERDAFKRAPALAHLVRVDG